ncbi:hypothetical protein LTR17_008718 [Elasticomyces elasticus]|nr:hypothetical protein LTR17_008718 [Elasticomyces elasticus]
MPTEPEWFLLKFTHCPEAADLSTLLGTIVPNFHTPQAKRTPVDPTFYTQDKYREYPVLSGVVYHANNAKETSTSAGLRPLLSMMRKTERDSHIDFSAGLIRSIRLEDYDDIFDLLIQAPEVRIKLEKWVGGHLGGKVYLIVGALVWEDASLDKGSNTTSDDTIESTMPLAQAITGMPSAGLGNVAAGRTANRADSRALSGKIEGKQILALEYKTIQRRPFSSSTRLTDDNPRYPKDQSFADGQISSDEPSEALAPGIDYRVYDAEFEGEDPELLMESDEYVTVFSEQD